MLDAAEEAGWAYEIPTLEDLATYYFGGRDPGNAPWSYMKEKIFMLHMQDFNDNYDIPEGSDLANQDWPTGGAGYTNYTCGPAYMKWHCLVFARETKLT